VKLYLVQHADALSKDTDPKRPLSEKGLKNVLQMAAFLRDAEVMVDEIVHSGKLRADETATVLSKAVWQGNTPKPMDGLAPNDSTDHLLHAAQVAGGDLMAVGHLPFMARMVARCLSGSEDGMGVNFEPGSMVCLERSEDDQSRGGWALSWMQRPRLLKEV